MTPDDLQLQLEQAREEIDYLKEENKELGKKLLAASKDRSYYISMLIAVKKIGDQALKRAGLSK